MSSHALAYDYESGPPVERGRLAVWLFIGSEAMFFAGLFSAWFVLRSSAADWPDAPRVSLPIGIAFTVVLGLASLAGAAAARAARRGDRARQTRWLLVTTLLGAAFLGGQAYEYDHLFHEGIYPKSDVAWGGFFALTACHGLHVLVGVLWNAALALQSARGKLPRWRARRVEYGVVYQHFVDVIWIFVFATVYVIG